MMKRLELSNKILGNFRDNWNELSWGNKRHFSYRASLVSENMFWKNQLLLTIPNTRIKYDEMISYSKNDIENYLNSNPYIFSSKPNNQLKRKPVDKYPEIKYWDDLLTHYRYLFISNSAPELAQSINVNRIKTVALDEDVVWGWPVWSVERIYDLKWFSDMDFTEDLRKVFESLYGNSDVGEAEEINYLYGLTHIVLGEASYYRNRNIKTWANDLLVSRFSKAVSGYSIDLASEIGLCLKLCKLDDLVDFRVLEDRIFREYNSIYKVIPRNGSYELNMVEHRNIISVLALNEWR